VSIYRFISAEKARTPVSTQCRLLGVSRSGYYDWARRAPSDRALADVWLLERIRAIHAVHRGVYGARRVHAELRLGEGIRVGRKRVERLAQAQISGLIRRKRGKTTIRVPGVRVADDLVERDFRPGAPDMLWVADITYLRCWEGWVYLAAVQDAYSRRIVGWAMADHMRAELVVDALQMALARRRPEPGLIHLRPGQPVRQSRVRPVRARRRDRGLDGLYGRLLRQRRRRELLRHPQEGADPPALLADPARAHRRGLRVHRGLL
jgi:putative transposase